MRFRTRLLGILLLVCLGQVCTAHSVVYEDDTGHPLFRLQIPEGWAVSLEGNRISLFPESSGAFIGAWFMSENFSSPQAVDTYIQTLCQAYFTEHQLEEPREVQIDKGLQGTLLAGKAKRDDGWGAVRALVFRPCADTICFAIQYTPDDVPEAPIMHESVIRRLYP